MTQDVVTPIHRGVIPTWTFAERIRKVRRDMGIDQGRMAELLDMGHQAYSAWETGRNKPRDLVGVAERLERLSGVPREWFLGWLDHQPPGGGAPVESGVGARSSTDRASDYGSEDMEPVRRLRFHNDSVRALPTAA